MVGRIFSLLVTLSFASALLCGRMAELQGAIFGGAATAVTLSLSLLGMQCLFCGLLSLLRRAGAVSLLHRLLSPFLHFAFPSTPEEGGLREIGLSVCANLLGVGNAATPFALSAIGRMQGGNPHPEAASDDMITLAVLNSNAFSLLPTTLLSLRAAGGSPSPSRVVPAVLFTGLISSFSAILLSRCFAKLFPYRGGHDA